MKKCYALTLLIFIAATFFAFISCSTKLPESEVTYSFDAKEPINFNVDKNADFIILQVADVQVGNTKDVDDGVALIKKLVEKVKPNLMVLTGDQSWLATKTHHFRLIDEIDAIGTPWSAVFGNHDHEAAPKTVLAQKYMEAKNSLFKVGPEQINGIGNYIINLVNKDDTNEILYSIFHLDSNISRVYSLTDIKNSKLGGFNYDFIYPNQIYWYQKSIEAIKSLNGDKLVKSLAFFHIPIPEFRHYFNAPDENILIPLKNDGEPVNCPVVNSGFFAKAKELQSTQAIFVGHDHVNNFAFKHEGIILSYGLKTGHGCYYDGELCGATVITLSDNFEKIDIKQIFDNEL